MILTEKKDRTDSIPKDTIRNNNGIKKNNRLTPEYFPSGLKRNRVSYQIDDLIDSLSRYTGFPEEFITSFGNPNQMREAVIRMAVNRGDNIIIAGPTDILFPLDTDGIGATRICHYGASPFNPDSEGLLEKVDDKTALIFLANPGSPTGAVYGPDDILQILEAAPQAWLLIDETLFEYGGITVSGMIRRHDNLLVLRTFTEAFKLAGNPCSYLLSSPAAKRKLKAFAGDRTPSEAAVTAAVSALANLESLNKRMERIRENMIFLSVKLRSLGVAGRITPLDLFLIKANDVAAVISFLKDNDIFAADLSYLPQMENYIGIHLHDDNFSNRLIATFEKMPAEYYRTPGLARTRIIMHRRREEAASPDFMPELVDNSIT